MPVLLLTHSPFFSTSEGNIQSLDVANNCYYPPYILSQMQTIHRYTFFDFNALLDPFDGIACAGDVPLTRVKFTAKHEYEFLANFKVLQNTLKQHKVDKVRILRP